MKKFVCTICGYVHEGDAAPEFCPICKAPAEKFKEQASLGEARSFLASAKTVGELKVITAQRDGMDAAAMRKQGDFLRDKEPGVVGVLASVNDGKVTLLAVCGKDAVAKGVKAGDPMRNWA